MTQKRKIIFSYLAVIILLVTNYASAQTKFCEKYPGDCEEANQFIRNNDSLFEHIMVKRHGFEKAFLLSIVAPEIAHFSSIQDQLETAALEVFYVNLGDDYADFSIGHFQMKPSFVQKLENYILKNEELGKFNPIARYPITDSLAMRKIRLERLKTVEWQTEYLCCFYAVLMHKFSGKTYSSHFEELAFIASAYNRGFDEDEKEIEKWQKIAWFPEKELNPESNFVYCKVSLDFYGMLGKNTD